MNAADLRSSFLEHFKARDHRVVRSSSLIPGGDATILFTNAGMNQFKDTFLGLEKRPYSRAASVQKCLRVSGKHNDLEQVGRTARHHTFFEMLGNFSFGDYFKKEAIAYAWEWITGTLRIQPAKLWVTVFNEDDEAESLWRSVARVEASRIVRLGEKDNFWSMADTGPCGPCSEIHFDQGPGVGCRRATCAVGCDCDRYLEFWNLVFMQFDRQQDGSMKPLAAPSIDTGMGLERIAAITQGVTTNYRSDLFLPVIGAIGERAGVSYGAAESSDVCLQVIADHLRAMTFLIADGVVPSNEKRGYVLRRVIRRALTFGRTLRLTSPFLHDLTGKVIDGIGEAYPELAEKRDLIASTCRREEEAFEATLARGVDVAEEIYRRFPNAEVEAAEAVRLYTTYGLSFEIQGALALPLGARLPSPSALESEMEKHREQARASWKGADAPSLPPDIAALAGSTRSTFLGYESLRVADARIVALFKKGGRAKILQEGEQGFALLDRTPFYAESGGQVGDTGRLGSQEGSEAEVQDTTSPAQGLVVHHVRVLSGALEEGGVVDAAVNAEARAATMRNHTATHLLHAALKKVLGPQVQQAGSYVGPDRLRFDFNFPGPVRPADLLETERQVNDQILINTQVDKTERAYDDAIRGGAVALFGEKYGDRVRVVTVPGYSQELCGGTHCRGTGDIGQLVIVSERGIAAGVRRIEAVTGMAAWERARENETLLREAEGTLNRKRDQIHASIETLLQENRKLEREVEKLRLKVAQTGTSAGAAPAFEEVGGVRLIARKVDGLDRGGLRTLADNLKREIGSGVVVLGSTEEGKVSLLVAVTDDLAPRLDARVLIKGIAELVGGGGGGKSTLAEAGGKIPEKLDEALRAGPAVLARALAVPRALGAVAIAVALLLSAGVPASAEIRHEVHGDEIVATNVVGKSKATPATLAEEVGTLRAQAAPLTPASPPDVSDMLTGSAVRYGFDPALIQSVVAAESAFDQRAVSRAGARGLMQLMPGTARRYGLRDVHDPGSNLEAGVAYLRELVNRFGGDVTLALAAYNSGPEAVARYGGIPPYEETHQYLERIRSYYGEDLQRGDRANGSHGIRLAKVESNGVPLYTNVRPRRVPRPTSSSNSKGKR